jgi:hypothetical protein
MNIHDKKKSSQKLALRALATIFCKRMCVCCMIVCVFLCLFAGIAEHKTSETLLSSTTFY